MRQERTNRIDQLFKRKQHGILSVYCTAGFPAIDSTTQVLEALEKHGADMIELGIPFSDPLADGPVIQHSNASAISNGMSVPQLLRQLAGYLNKAGTPLILMGYLNPIMQYGFEKFCIEAATAGVDGLIIPDLPPAEFESRFATALRFAGLHFIFLVTPETPEARVKMLDRLGSGFLYAVASSSVTGGMNDPVQLESFLNRLRSWRLTNPVLAGFGIRDRQGFELVNSYVSGAIIGSAFIRAIANGDDIDSVVGDFIQSIRG